MKRLALAFTLLAGLTGLTGCGDGVASEEEAERAYLGLDASIDRAIGLGFDGFNAASSANIPPQTANGTKGGKMIIGGKVDQGASNNKTMSLTITLEAYTDDELLIYDTDPAALPVLDMKLSKIPDGTLEGSLNGTFLMSGELEGPVRLSLSFAGDLEPAGDGVQRKAGTTTITGSADSDFGIYEVDVTR
jgi:hypothetical protein